MPKRKILNSNKSITSIGSNKSIRSSPRTPVASPHGSIPRSGTTRRRVGSKKSISPSNSRPAKTSPRSGSSQTSNAPIVVNNKKNLREWQLLNREYTNRNTSNNRGKIITQQFREDICHETFTTGYIIEQLNKKNTKVIILKTHESEGPKGNSQTATKETNHKYDIDSWAIYTVEPDPALGIGKDQLYVILLCSRRKLGWKLVDLLIKSAIKHKKTEIVLDPITSAVNFYQRQGFKFYNNNSKSMKLTENDDRWKIVKRGGIGINY